MICDCVKHLPFTLGEWFVVLPEDNSIHSSYFTLWLFLQIGIWREVNIFVSSTWGMCTQVYIVHSMKLVSPLPSTKLHYTKMLTCCIQSLRVVNFICSKLTFSLRNVHQHLFSKFDWVVSSGPITCAFILPSVAQNRVFFSDNSQWCCFTNLSECVPLLHRPQCTFFTVAHCFLPDMVKTVSYLQSLTFSTCS